MVGRKTASLLILLILCAGCGFYRVGKLFHSGQSNYFAKPVAVSYKDIHNSIIVKGKINDSAKEYTFFVDTAAPCIIDEALAKELNLPDLGDYSPFDSTGNTQKVRLTKLDSLSVGGARVERIGAAVTDLKPHFDRYNGYRVDGFVGFNFLRYFVTTIDPEKKELIFNMVGPYGRRWLDDEARKEGALKIKTMDVPYLDYMVPAVEVKVESKDAGWYILDTGFSGSLTVKSSLVKSMGYTPESPGAAEVKGHGGAGLFGSLTGGYKLPARNVSVNGNDLGPTVVWINDGVSHYLLGMGILMRYRTTFCYSIPKLVMVPQKEAKDPEYFSTGLVYLNDEGIIRICSIIVGSPADEAGLMPGYEIVSINGEPASSLGLLKVKNIERDREIEKIDLIVKNVFDREEKIVLVKGDLMEIDEHNRFIRKLLP